MKKFIILMIVSLTVLFSPLKAEETEINWLWMGGSWVWVGSGDPNEPPPPPTGK